MKQNLVPNRCQAYIEIKFIDSTQSCHLVKALKCKFQLLNFQKVYLLVTMFMPKGNAKTCQKKHIIRVSHLVIHINESWLSNTPFLFFVFLKLQFISNEIMPKLSVFNQMAQKDTHDPHQGFPFRYNDFS